MRVGQATPAIRATDARRVTRLAEIIPQIIRLQVIPPAEIIPRVGIMHPAPVMKAGPVPTRTVADFPAITLETRPAIAAEASAATGADVRVAIETKSWRGIAEP